MYLKCTPTTQDKKYFVSKAPKRTGKIILAKMTDQKKNMIQAYFFIESLFFLLNFHKIKLYADNSCLEKFLHLWWGSNTLTLAPKSNALPMYQLSHT